MPNFVVAKYIESFDFDGPRGGTITPDFTSPERKTLPPVSYDWGISPEKTNRPVFTTRIWPPSAFIELAGYYAYIELITTFTQNIGDEEFQFVSSGWTMEVDLSEFVSESVVLLTDMVTTNHNVIIKQAFRALIKRSLPEQPLLRLKVATNMLPGSTSADEQLWVEENVSFIVRAFQQYLSLDDGFTEPKRN